MPKVGDHLLAKTKKLEIRGHIVGIDHYHLENFAGNQHRWFSYTLISNKNSLFSRYWITDWKESGWFLWTPCKEIKNLKNKKTVQDRSGIAKITFEGDQGASTPVAALVLYKTGKNQYYATERFAGSRVMYFRAEKIQKPKITT